jgi:hypothetical protein
MIISTAIEAAKASGGLIPFIPPLTGLSRPRAFLMTKRLKEQISEGLVSPDAKRVERWDRLRADIAYYVGNGLVTWSLMRWLDPKKFEHWELRSVRPRPSLRVFGRFAEADVFIGTHMVERAPLGGKWSLNWELEKLICEDEWNQALPGCAPFRASSYEEYITENAYRFPRVPS